jgi:two-component system chemotaxis response regulator CheB
MRRMADTGRVHPELPPVLVTVGASAGGIEALRALVARLPLGLPAAVLVVLHLPRTATSALPAIIERSGEWPARHAVDGERIRPGRIYVAPPDHHLLVIEGRARLSRGPAENGHRPAVDPLFRSAARTNGERTIAVVLSGSRDDGAAGAATVVQLGGEVVVQSPDEALHPSMPRSVLDHVAGARAVPTAELGPVVAGRIEKIVSTDPAAPALPPALTADDLPALETRMADFANTTAAAMPGHPSAFACPACHGGLFELPGEPVPRYRCWVGHAWSPESLLDEQTAAFDGALWMALRSLEEKTALARRMDVAARDRGQHATADRYRTAGDDAEQAGTLIRELIRRLDAVVADVEEER